MSVVVYADHQPWMEVETETETGAPKVRITLVGMGVEPRYLTLTRICEGESQVVPGWRNRTIVDADTDVDWFAPLNREIAYNISENGQVISTARITLPSDSAWISDPLQPDIALPVKVRGTHNTGFLTMVSDALRDVRYAAPSNIAYPMGGKYGIGLGSRRHAASGVTLAMVSEDKATTAGFRRLIDGPPILVFRPSTEIDQIPPVGYLLADVAELPITAHYDEDRPFTKWAVTGDLVAAVTQAAVTGMVTYQEVQDLMAGYTYEDAQVFLAATIYLDVQKNPRKVAGQ